MFVNLNSKAEKGHTFVHYSLILVSRILIMLCLGSLPTEYNSMLAHKKTARSPLAAKENRILLQGLYLSDDGVDRPQLLVVKLLVFYRSDAVDDLFQTACPDEGTGHRRIVQHP